MKTITIQIPTSHFEVEFERIESKNYRASFGEYDGYGRNRSHAFEDLVNNMPDGEELKEHPFPNGFTSWHETHYFVSGYIAETEDTESSLACRRRAEQGIGGLWELAQELTEEFEKLHEGRQWDGEWMDDLEKWLQNKDDEGMNESTGNLPDKATRIHNVDREAAVESTAIRWERFQDDLDRMTDKVLSFIKSYLDKYREFEFEDGVNLSYADEEIKMIYKEGDRYTLETTINSSGETWGYDLRETDRIALEDLLWIARVLAEKGE